MLLFQNCRKYNLVPDEQQEAHAGFMFKLFTLPKTKIKVQMFFDVTVALNQNGWLMPFAHCFRKLNIWAMFDNTMDTQLKQKHLSVILIYVFIDLKWLNYVYVHRLSA